ncbi:MAG: CBS domain-containing protein [Deltaproteobacteria bacterium]|jgi:CBS domain-containing protein|nr:CBS domain-containing protein [Deltaproteobacteria bacterium]MDA8306109.1 CBS domain-containing protein [Deltaproteobacteria bacterium]
MKAGDFCTREVVITGKDSTIVEAARLMRDYHVGDLVVTEERDGEQIPIGILTDRDIVVEVVARESDYLRSLAVGDIMSTELVTVRENDSLSDTLKRMCALGIRRVPVVNNRGALVGILSVDDLVEQVCEELTDITRLIAWQQKREKQERT